jgi:hypothetical protein
MKPSVQRPTGAFVGASWAARLIGASRYTDIGHDQC